MADTLTMVWYQVGEKVIVVFALLKFAIRQWNTFLINVVMLYIILMHISQFMFLANGLLLVVYFKFILDYGNDVRQKQKLK